MPGYSGHQQSQQRLPQPTKENVDNGDAFERRLVCQELAKLSKDHPCKRLRCALVALTRLRMCVGSAIAIALRERSAPATISLEMQRLVSFENGTPFRWFLQTVFHAFGAVSLQQRTTRRVSIEPFQSRRRYTHGHRCQRQCVNDAQIHAYLRCRIFSDSGTFTDNSEIPLAVDQHQVNLALTMDEHAR
jgi:hypothetical protein